MVDAQNAPSRGGGRRGPKRKIVPTTVFALEPQIHNRPQLQRTYTNLNDVDLLVPEEGLDSELLGNLTRRGENLVGHFNFTFETPLNDKSTPTITPSITLLPVGTQESTPLKVIDESFLQPSTSSGSPASTEAGSPASTDVGSPASTDARSPASTEAGSPASTGAGSPDVAEAGGEAEALPETRRESKIHIACPGFGERSKDPSELLQAL